MSARSIISMNHTTGELEQIAWGESRLRREIDEAHEAYDKAMAALKAADPEGWEAWYDDENNLPDFQWKDVELCRENTQRIWDHVYSITGVRE